MKKPAKKKAPAKKTPEKKPPFIGRPPKEISAELVFEMACENARISDIAALMGVSRDTIERRFREEIERGKAWFRISLSRAQARAALTGDKIMQIWLGKQELEQKEPDKAPPVPAAPPKEPYPASVSTGDLVKRVKAGRAEEAH